LYPTEVARSREQLIAPLAARVGLANARAVYHLAMGMVHDALAESNAPTKREVEAMIQFATRGCSDE